MPTEHIFLTTLLRPHEAAQFSGYLRVAAHFSFILEGGDHLSDFPWLSQWTAKAKGFSFRVKVGDQPAEAEAQLVPGSGVIDPMGGPEMWKALFPPTTAVRERDRERDLMPPSIISTYDAKAFHEEALHRYRVSAHSGVMSRSPAKSQSRSNLTFQQFQQARSFFKSGRTPVPSAPSAPAPPDFDFILGALHDYPSLLRALGLVFELRFPVQTSVPIDLITISVPELEAVPGLKAVGIGAWGDGDWAGHYEDGIRITPITLDVAHAASSMAASSNHAPIALRTSGISILYEEQGGQSPSDALKAKMNRAKDILTNRIVDASHVRAGYRVDVTEYHPDRGTSRTLSLCRRAGTLTLGGSHSAPQHTLPTDDEGYVSCALSRVDEDVFRLNPMIARWLGWSLTVPRPDTPVPHYDSPTVASSAIIRSELTAVSLPSLRFGHEYKFALRPVDITGYSAPPPKPDTVLPDAQLSTRVRYLRFEPIKPPIFVPCEKFGPAESLMRMVVPQVGVSQRWVVPPDTTFEMAERHGVFDRAFATLDHGALEVALTRDGKSLWQQHIPETASMKAEINAAQSVFSSVPGGPQVPHLPDPVARNAVFLNLGAAGVFGVLDQELVGGFPFEVTAPAEATNLASEFAKFLGEDDILRPGPKPVDPKYQYPENFKPFLLVLRGVPAGEPGSAALDLAARTLTFRVPAGRTAKLRVCSAPGPGDFYSLGVSHPALDETSTLRADDQTWQKLAVKGQLPAVSPGIELTLVHPVPCQLTAPVLKITRTIRAVGETAVHFSGSIDADHFATDHVAIYWVEFVGTEWGPQRKNSYIGSVRPDSNNLFTFDDLRYDFHDTRARNVTLVAKAVGAYREYFAPDAAGPFYIESHPVIVQVLSSAPPHVPKVAHTLPIFQNAGMVDANGSSLTHTRTGNGLRLYLNGPFNTSGPDEQIAVLCERAGESAPAGMVTVYGADPLSGGTLPQALSMSSFGTATGRAWEDPKGYTTKALFVVLFPIQYDATLGRSFSDILFSPEWDGAYGPFVKLAVAIYQPNAVPGCSFSGIAHSKFAQLPATRTITISMSAKQFATTYEINAEISVNGPVPVAAGPGPGDPSLSLSTSLLDPNNYLPLQTTLKVSMFDEKHDNRALGDELSQWGNSVFEPDEILKASLGIPPKNGPGDFQFDPQVPGLYKGVITQGDFPSLPTSVIVRLTEIEVQNFWFYHDINIAPPNLPEVKSESVFEGQNAFRVIWHQQFRLTVTAS